MRDSQSEPVNRRTVLKTTGTALTLGTVGLAGCSGGGDGGDSSSPTPEQGTSGGDGGGGTTSMSEEEQLMREANPPDPLVVTKFPIKPNYAMLYAARNGLFEDRGINFKWTDKPIFGGANNLSAVLAGNAHISSGTSAPGAINLLRNRDTTVKLVWPQVVNDLDNDYNSGDYLVAHTDYETVADLKGQTLVTHSGGPGLVLVGAKWNLEQAGVNPNEDVDIRQVPLPQLGGTIAQEDAAGGIMLEPDIMQAIDKGFPIHRLNPAYSWIRNGVVVGAWTTSDFASEHEATVKLIQRALAEANEVMRSDPSKIADAVGASDDFSTSAAYVNTLLERKDLGNPVGSVQAARPLESLQRIDELLWKFAPQVTERLAEDRLQGIVLPWNRA